MEVLNSIRWKVSDTFFVFLVKRKVDAIFWYLSNVQQSCAFQISLNAMWTIVIVPAASSITSCDAFSRRQCDFEKTVDHVSHARLKEKCEEVCLLWGKREWAPTSMGQIQHAHHQA